MINETNYPTPPPKLYGLPRSGGTLIYNVMNHIFDGNVGPQSHDYFEFSADEATTDDPRWSASLPPIVAVYRDFRDSLASQWRAYTLDRTGANLPKMSLAQVYSSALGQKQAVQALYSFREYQKNHPDQKILFLRYEDFFDSTRGDVNFDFLFQQFEEFFGICEDDVLTKEKKDYIRKEFCFSSQKKFASNFKSFHEGFDPDLTGDDRMKALADSGLLEELEKRQIHGNHLNTGKSTWKDLISPEHYEIVNQILGDELRDWGYL